MVNRGRQPKMAVMTPVLPDPTGIAYFNVPFLAELGKHVELHVFTATQRPLPVPEAASIRPLVTVPSVSASYDRVLGVMGNSTFHLDIFEKLVRYGGACVAHDARLAGLYWLFLGQKRARRVAEHELGRSVPLDEIESWQEDESKLGTLFLSELMQACEPIFFHSRETVRLANELSGKLAIHLPFPIYREWSRDQLGEQARRKTRAGLGIEAGEIAIMTFGSSHWTKAPKAIIMAIELLRSMKVAAKLYFVGAVIDVKVRELDMLCREIGVEPYIKFVDQYVSEESYRDYLLAADFSIQLRVHGFGGISGALQDCIAAGIPTVANENLCEAIDAPGYVTRVPDDLSSASIADAIAGMVAENKHIYRQDDEREQYSRERNFQIYTRRLLQAQGIEVTASR
jgi:glycosyltransferase involved in cell wall biosynthesis